MINDEAVKTIEDIKETIDELRRRIRYTKAMAVKASIEREKANKDLMQCEAEVHQLTSRLWDAQTKLVDVLDEVIAFREACKDSAESSECDCKADADCDDADCDDADNAADECADDANAGAASVDAPHAEAPAQVLPAQPAALTPVIAPKINRFASPPRIQRSRSRFATPSPQGPSSNRVFAPSPLSRLSRNSPISALGPPPMPSYLSAGGPMVLMPLSSVPLSSAHCNGWGGEATNYGDEDFTDQFLQHGKRARN